MPSEIIMYKWHMKVPFRSAKCSYTNSLNVNKKRLERRSAGGRDCWKYSTQGEQGNKKRGAEAATNQENNYYRSFIKLQDTTYWTREEKTMAKLSSNVLMSWCCGVSLSAPCDSFTKTRSRGPHYVTTHTSMLCRNSSLVIFWSWVQ